MPVAFNLDCKAPTSLRLPGATQDNAMQWIHTEAL